LPDDLLSDCIQINSTNFQELKIIWMIIMQENELEQQKANKKLNLSFKHQKEILPLLDDVEKAKKDGSKVSFDRYLQAVSYRLPKKPSENEFVGHAVADLLEAIEFHKDVSLWTKEQNGLERTVGEIKPRGRLQKFVRFFVEPAKVSDARLRLKEIGLIKKEREESVARMAAAYDYIRQKHSTGKKIPEC